MFPDEQLGGPIVELFAGLFADLHTRGSAARAEFVGLGNIVFDALAAKVVGQRATAVPFLLGPRGGRFGRRRRLRQSGFGGGDFAEQFE